MTATWETPSTKSGFYILPTNLVVTLKSCSLFLLVKTTNDKSECGIQRSDKSKIKIIILKLVVMPGSRLVITLCCFAEDGKEM